MGEIKNIKTQDDCERRRRRSAMDVRVIMIHEDTLPRQRIV